MVSSSLTNIICVSIKFEFHVNVNIANPVNSIKKATKGRDNHHSRKDEIILIGSPRRKQTIIVDRIKMAGIIKRKSGILIISSSTFLGGP